MVRKTLLLLVLGMPALLSAQPLTQVKVIEPTAASMAKYGDYKVDYSTGLPGISIPLYTIKSGDLSLDLSLSYHGGGVKLNEDASWVGLGWDLFWGGSITRQVVGLPDELEDYRDSALLPNAMQILDNIRNDPYNFSNVDYDSQASGSYCFKQDVFHFSVGGYSGTFVLDNHSRPMVIPYSALKVEGFPATPGHSVLLSDGGNLHPVFTITTPDGTRYLFSDGDVTHDLTHYATAKDFCTSWYVSAIISANGTDTLRFEYQSDGWISNVSQMYTQGAEYTYQGCSPIDALFKSSRLVPLSGSSSSQDVESVKPSYIYFRGGRVSFHLASRDDIYTGQSVALHRLDQVVVERQDGEGYAPIRTYHLYQSDLLADQPYRDPRDQNRWSPNCLRLRLDSVSVTGEDGKTESLAQLRYYDDQPMAPKYSFATDFWGYYNGRTSSTPIPLTIMDDPTTSGGQMVVGGANKSPDEAYMRLGSLKSIAYPTGGRTELEWEMNRSSVGVVNVYEPVTVSANSLVDPNLDHTTYSSPTIDGEFDPVPTYFTVYVAQQVAVDYTLSMRDPNDLNHQKYDLGAVVLRNLNTNEETVISDQLPSSGTKFISLKANTRYALVVESNCNNIMGNANFVYNAYNPEPDGNKSYPIGGLRVKSIASYGNDGQLAFKKRFTYLDPATGNSSGALNNDRRMDFQKNTTSVTGGPMNYAEGGITTTCINTVVRSETIYSDPVVGVYANTVTYQYVQEYAEKADGSSDGYTEYEYSVYPDYEAGKDLPLISYSWLRGQLLRTTVYGAGATPQKKLETVNRYQLQQDGKIYDQSVGYSMTKYINISGLCNVCLGGFTAEYVYGPLNYHYDQQWQVEDSTATTTYYDDGTSSSVSTRYYYDNPQHAQVTRTVTTRSDGTVKTVKRKYPQDYAGVAVADSLVARGMIGTAIEEQELQRGADGHDRATKGTLWQYGQDAFGHLLPAEEWTLSLQQPSELVESVDGSGKYTSLFPTSSGGGYALEGRFAFDGNGRLSGYVAKDGAHSSFLWDSQGKHLLCKVANAGLGEWYFRSFDSLSVEGSWTGEQQVTNPDNPQVIAWELQGSGASMEQVVPAAQLRANTTYTVEVVGKVAGSLPDAGLAVGGQSVHFTGSGSWESVRLQVTTGDYPSDLPVYVKTSVSGGAAGSGELYLLSIRVYPADAQVTSYTWMEGDGLTSQTDPSGQVTYYLYDGLGRLLLVKDSRGHVLKRYSYHYVGLPPVGAE